MTTLLSKEQLLSIVGLPWQLILTEVASTRITYRSDNNSSKKMLLHQDQKDQVH